MNRQEVMDYILHTPYNTNPTILNQKLDEMVEEEAGGVVAVAEKVPLPKIVAGRDIPGEGNVLVDYYNQNLHADADEVIDAFFENTLFCKLEAPYDIYGSGVAFGISNFYDGTLLGVTFGHSAPISLLKYITRAELELKAKNHALGIGTKGQKVKKKLLVAQGADQFAVNWITGELASLTDVVHHLVNGTLFYVIQETDRFVVWHGKITSNGEVTAATTYWNGFFESATCLPIYNWNDEVYLNTLRSSIKEKRGDVLFFLSNHGKEDYNPPYDCITGEAIDADFFVDKFFQGKSYHCEGGGLDHGIRPTQYFAFSNDDDKYGYDTLLYNFCENGTFLANKAIHPYAPLILHANKENTTPTTYLESPLVGDAILEGIQNNKQVLVRTPNGDDGVHTAIYSPVLTYQLPNYENDYLYLFYLRDEKQDLSQVLGAPIQLPTYGELKLKLSNPYSHSPIE